MHASSEGTITMTANLLAAPPRAGRERRSGEAVARLVSAADHGDHAAWNDLVDEFGGLIWAVARAHRLEDADAADVAQATWLALLEHLGQINDRSRVGAWLATTARHECLRILRKRDRQIPFGDDAPECESSEMPPGDALLIRERDSALWRSFSHLRERDQALLRILMIDPRPPYEEIAAALDMPIGSIGPTRQRALERLRKALDDHGALSLMTA